MEKSRGGDSPQKTPPVSKKAMVKKRKGGAHPFQFYQKEGGLFSATSRIRTGEGEVRIGELLNKGIRGVSKSDTSPSKTTK